MRILYIHQYFKTPYEAGGTRSYWFAKKLIENGYEVVMLTSNMSKEGRKFIMCKEIDGIKVKYVRNRYDNEMGKIRRILSFLRFMFIASIIAIKQKKVDLVFATSTPLTIALPALLLKKFKKIPYVFEVRDLWPEFPIQMGAIKNKLLKEILLCFEKITYKNANHIIALSPGMKRGIVKQKIEPRKVTIIPNMSKPQEFFPRKKNRDLAIRLKIDLSKFNVVSFGTMGKANGLDYIIKAAEFLNRKEMKEINFILLGNGSEKSRLQKECKKKKLCNVFFLESQPMKITSEIVNLCDMSIVTFKNLPVLYTNSPNKLFDSLSAGKPIIVNSAGWTKEVVERNKCGLYVDPERPSDLVEKLMILKNDRNIIDSMCRNSIKLSKEYDREKLSQQFVDTLKNHLDD